MQLSFKNNFKLKGVQILALGFILVILFGAIILSLPISAASGTSTNFLDSLFTATSAVCVTGLITLDTSTHWSTFGQVVIMLLIEIGGLGFMAFSTLFALVLGRRISFRQRLVMQEAYNTFSIEGMVKMVKYVLGFTFLTQIFGALLLSTQFVPEYGIAKGAYYSIFHSISAFCNAGFDLFGTSLVGYQSNVIIILVISLIIIAGGLGFTVWYEIYNYKELRKLSLHSKVVILITTILILGGWILMFVFEYNNPQTMAGMDLGDKVLNSFFASVTPRTAGFNSISTADMTIAGKFLTIIFMFIGGSPGSTAGGFKTATIGILLITVICVIKGREDTEIFGRRISRELIYKAFSLFFIAMGLIITVTMILSVTEPGVAFIDLLYEATSAFGTVGLTAGVTPGLSSVGKVCIMIMMYFGRVGPLTVALSLTRRKKDKGYKYPEGKILIG